MKKNKILIVIHSNTFFVELFRLANYLLSCHEYEPVMLFAYRYPTYLDDVSRCDQLKIPCLDVNGKQIEISGLIQVQKKQWLVKKTDSDLSQRIWQILKTTYTRSLTICRQLWLIQLITELRSFLDAFRNVRNILIEQNPPLLVLGGDMVTYNTSVYIDAAHQRNIPVVILPSTMSNGLEQAEVYFHDPNYSLGKVLNYIAAKLYPKWVKVHRGRKLLRVSGARVLVMECLGLAPPLPWSFNSGFADAIIVESEYMKQYYLNCGIPESQLRLIGSLADNVMTGILRQKNQKAADLCRELGVKEDKPILLSALPPDFLYMPGGRPECDFKIYSELVEFWVKSIAQVDNFNVLVCLHPSVRYEDFYYIEDWGVKIARMNTAELIPLSDLYVASVSSTIRWAIACGIPVINYDVYRYHYTDYLNVKGVLAVEEKEDFEFVLDKITRDSNFYKQIKLEQEHSASQWGMFDGKVGQRLRELFTSMITSYGEENRQYD